MDTSDNGQLSAITDEVCTPGDPNSDISMVTYTPDSAFVGVDTFTYMASDTGGRDSNTATVNIRVGLPPEVFSASRWALFGLAVAFGVLLWRRKLG